MFGDIYTVTINDIEPWEFQGKYRPPFLLFTKWSKKAIMHDNTTLTISKVTIVST